MDHQSPLSVVRNADLKCRSLGPNCQDEGCYSSSGLCVIERRLLKAAIKKTSPNGEVEVKGTPDGIRTHDVQIRSLNRVCP
jgi:hypothetical protein